MSLYAELKRRRVFRVSVAYGVVAWMLIEVSDTVLPRLGLPEWTVTLVIALSILAFPAALFLSWAYDLTPDGIEKTEDLHPAESITRRPGRKLDVAVIALLMLALGWFAWDKFGTGSTPLMADADAPTPSIAVLPFVNLSSDPEQEYFSDGLAEEVLNLLAQIEPLTVVGRTSSFAFKDRNEDLRAIGAALGVAYLVEGSVRREGDEVRITAQLVQADDASNVWSESYDRRLESIFAIQTDVARAIAEALRLNLAAEMQPAPVARGTASLPAYELFLQARRLIQGRTETGITTARGLLDEALVLDQDYAPALAASAQAILLLAETSNTYGDIPLGQAIAEARPLIERALARDPGLAEAHAVRGLMLLVGRHSGGAEAALARALELNPSHSDALNWRAIDLAISGHLREQLAVRRKLAEIDPLNAPNLFNLAAVLLAGDEPDRAADVAARIQRDFPDSPFGFLRHAEVLHHSGRLAEATAQARRALTLAPEQTMTQVSVGSTALALGDYTRVLSLPSSYQHGVALFGMGRAEDGIAAARARVADAPDDPNSSSALLGTLSLAGRHDEVLRLYAERWGSMAALEAFFGFDLLTTEIATELAAVASAQRALDRRDDLAATLEYWSDRLAFMRRQGYGHCRFLFIEASYQALAGERAAALTTLAKAIDKGHRTPFLSHEAAFSELRGDPAFEAQVARMTGLIDAERAKLGMKSLR